MKIAFCIFTSIRSKSGLVEDYMVELTHYYAYRMKFALPRDTRQPDIVFADSIDNGLKKYANLYDHILFMAAGCRITEDNVITDNRTTIISRYFLLKLTLKFNNTKTKVEDGFH